MGAVTPDMDWLVAPEADTDATTTARGLHEILCNSSNPLLRQLVPSLPWHDGPTNTSALIPYAGAASVMWAGFKMPDDSTACPTNIFFKLLKPTTMARALNKLQALKFDFSTPLEYTPATLKIQAFVAESPDPAFILHEADLETIAPGALDLLPTGARWIRDIESGQFTAHLASTAPLCIFEVLTAPRETTVTRYDANLPCMRTMTQMERALRQSDSEIFNMIEAKASANDVKEKLAESLPDLFVNLTCPPVLLATSLDNLHKKCLKRSKTATALLRWSFSPNDRDDMIIQQIIKVVASFASLAKVVLPCASQVECYELLGMLRNTLTPALQLPDTSTMKSIDSMLHDNGFVSLVDTDERRDKPGSVKTPMVIAQIQLTVAAGGSTSTSTLPNSTSTGSNGSMGSDKTSRDNSINAATQAWLMQPVPQALEAEIMSKLKEPPDYAAAISLIARSQFVLYIQMLTWRDSLGQSETAKMAKQIRPHRSAAFSFAITAETDEHNNLVQDTDYADYIVLVVFDKCFWAWEWGNLNPFTLLQHIQQHKQGSRVTLTSSDKDILWGDLAANRAVSEIMDRAYYMLGMINGVFSNFIAHANQRLEAAVGLPKVDLLTIKKKVTRAVVQGLTDAGTSFASTMKATSHTNVLPCNGRHLILVPDSTYIKLLQTCSTKIKAIENDEFWADRKDEEAAKEAKLELLGAPSHMRSPLHRPSGLGFVSLR